MYSNHQKVKKLCMALVRVFHGLIAGAMQQRAHTGRALFDGLASAPVVLTPEMYTKGVADGMRCATTRHLCGERLAITRVEFEGLVELGKRYNLDDASQVRGRLMLHQPSGARLLGPLHVRVA